MDVDQLLKSVESKKGAPVKKREDKSFDNVMDSISKNWESSLEDDELSRLKNQLKEAQKEIKKLKTTSSPFTKNEDKIMSAIKSESINQKTDWPIISYNKFRKVYKVSSSYYRPSINSLLDKGSIDKQEAVFSGDVKTYRWKVLEK